MHSGVCRAATGACHHCGSMDHKVRDCPEEDLRPKSQNKGAGERVCYNCGETGHYKNQCPKDAQSAGKRPSDGPQPAAKRQAIMPRVYTIGDESNVLCTDCLSNSNYLLSSGLVRTVGSFHRRIWIRSCA
ncbi:hypothetical protein DY000_02033147 [Brassica cretica]|uniref:CCHC-type domain-containing protein n=1 Tax=Brassica cretica TaxID=69181 RepID=A0ABQ7DUZ1_BRACR|nr:hypothetical protein DY000_02033147 [Brassica cretica]